MAGRMKRGRGEGSLWFQKSRRVWVAEVVTNERDGTHKRRASAATKAEAGRHLRGLLAGAGMRQVAGFEAGPPTVAVALTAWLDRKEREAATGELAQSTVADYKQVVRDYLMPTIGRVPLMELSHQHVEELLAEHDGHVGGRRVIRTLRLGLAYARAAIPALGPGDGCWVV